MTTADQTLAADRATRCAAVYPLSFAARRESAADIYLSDPATRDLAEFFVRKGLTAIKDEDRREQWYEDWLAYQREYRIYASVLSPAKFSTLGFQFDLLRYSRFLEVFAYFSPAHGYSAQVSFLGLFAILMGGNDELKREAVAELEKGGLLAFGVSEKHHGADLLSYEFKITEAGAGKLIANGSKYYVGNSNAAAMIAILAKKPNARHDGSPKRIPFALFALRPKRAKGFRDIRKIRTLGVRAGYVGEFDVKDHELPASDIIAEGRGAWDAVLGTVTLGKFFLGFGSIGMCEHAIEEAVDHLRARILYGKPVIDMPHIRMAMAQAWSRLTGMKLYAYRALDYVHAADANERRYLLYCAVQKAMVSTQGVKVMALLSECVGAKGFESDTYFEMALRDIQLIPGLEGSTHINLALATQFIGRYFKCDDEAPASPKSLVAGEVPSRENEYLMDARIGGFNTIAFGHFLAAYEPLMSIPNVRLFMKQARTFRDLLRKCDLKTVELDTSLMLGQCVSAIAYAQLVAENATRLDVPPQIVSAIFHLLVLDFNIMAAALASSSKLHLNSRLIRRLIRIPQTSTADWDFVAARMDAR